MLEVFVLTIPVNKSPFTRFDEVAKDSVGRLSIISFMPDETSEI